MYNGRNSTPLYTVYIYNHGHPTAIWRTELACLMNADICLNFHSTYFKDLFSSHIDINLGENQTSTIFSSARKPFVPLDVNLMADYKTIRKVPVWTATQHTTLIRSVT